MDASILTDLAHDLFVQTVVLATASGVGRDDDAQDLSQREILVAEGARLRSLAIIGTSVAVVSCPSEEGELELRRLAPSDYFGESGLFSGTCGMAMVRALTFTVVYEVGQAELAKLVQARPNIDSGSAVARRLTRPFSCSSLSRWGRLLSVTVGERGP
jgi:CRP-like cAMP-binding protein